MQNFALEILAFPAAREINFAPEEPFLAPLARGAGWCGDRCGAHGPAIAAAAADWFLSRAVAETRYVLFVDWSASGYLYGAWVEKMSAASGRWPTVLVAFPDLAIRIARIAEDIVAALDELQSRLIADQFAISQEFGIASSILTEVETGLSDAHNNGRSVLRLRFATGETLIYKPKPLAIEAAFNAAAWDVLAGFGISPLKVLDRGSYGWVEDAGPRRRLDRSEKADGVDLGRAAGLFWMLNATDLHVENVLPGRTGTQALDLETLFSVPWVDAPEGQRHWRAHSVTSTLLFDGSVFARSRIGNISGFDPTPSIGALSSEIDFRVASDRIEATPRATARSFNPPVTRALDARAVIAGFREATTPAARAQVRTFIDMLPRTVALRFVARETFFYARILERLRQPKYLRTIGARAADLQRLYASIHATGAVRCRLSALVDGEIRQLLDGDIPYFSYRIDSTGPADLQVGWPIFSTAPRLHAISKISGLQGSDIDEQATLIGIALGEPPTGPALAQPGDESVHGMVGYLAELVRHQGFEPEGEACRWLTLRGDVSKSDLRVTVGDGSFFGGTTGILLALQAAEHVTGDTVLGDFLDDQAERWVPEVIQDGGRISPLGFSGLGGALFAASVLGRLNPTRWRHMADWAAVQISATENSITGDVIPDVIAGSAGLALALASLPNRHQPCVAAALAAAKARVADNATVRGPGVAWTTPASDEILLGYAHGWAGMISALFAGGGPGDHAGLIEGALDWLDSDVQAHHGFVDHRSDRSVVTPLNMSWCNGSAGILRGLFCCDLSRRPYLAVHADRELDRVLNAAGTLSELRFCCGDMGLIDLILDLYASSGDPGLAQKAVGAGTACLTRAVQSTTLRDRPPEIAYPGLFQNLAGILYVGCRLLSTDIPSLSGQAPEDWRNVDRHGKFRADYGMTRPSPASR